MSNTTDAERYAALSGRDVTYDGYSQLMFGIVTKVSHPDAARLTKDLLEWLRGRGHPIIVESETASQLQLDLLSTEARVSRSELSQKCEVLIVLGGDGTLISVSRHPSPNPPIIIGVNLGTLGFLTEITSAELFGVLESVVAGTAVVQRRTLFNCSILRNGKPHASFSAVNDVVITKQALARIFALELVINSEPAAIVRGDGIIVATPAGSTAYSLAAGGSIVHPEVGALLVTPICPHSLTSRPLVLPSSSQVQLRLLNHTFENEVYLTVDGQAGMALTPEDTVTISTSRHHIRIATSPTKSYYQILNNKLKWATS